MNRLRLVLRRTVDALVRTPALSLTATATIFVATLLLGLFGASLSGAERLLHAWAGVPRVSVWLAPGTDPEAARRAAAALAPGRAVAVVPAAEALDRLARGLGAEAGALAGVGADALPDALEIPLAGGSPAEARALAARLREVPGAAEVDAGVEWLERLEGFLRATRRAGLALLAAAALAAAVLVSNTLQLAVYARRDEIELMKLVGATDAFVAAPFLLEGLVQGLAGGGLAAAALVGLHAALAERVAAAAGLPGALARGDLLPWGALAGLAAAGAAVGLLASALAVRRAIGSRAAP